MMDYLEKQNLPINDGTIARESVNPFLHSNLKIATAVENEDLYGSAIRESLAYYAANEEWSSVWSLADSMGREISILFDSQGLIWVDVGTPGMVRLSPPLGAELPLKLWVHSHPWNAYWSATDLRTLASVSGILEKALVLGHDHLVKSECCELYGSDKRLAADGPLASWTDEDAISYDAF
ncbi:MAG: hypothetical protein VYA86_01610 [Candidatus Thermoplasmatota archaeon]|nr:hypothetical protein [Candidatus Thermoplasmatota archaeon]